MGKVNELDMAKQELDAIQEPQEREQVISRDGEEIKFYLSDLSNEGQMAYVRANQIAQETQMLEQQLNEKRFLANNYINNVLTELDGDKEKTEDEQNTE
tara:strand:- start:11266 stop:11562 length:297 start_codon:yes stop_codon:yes gene_type:complete